jgi:hypothetical protein
LPDTKIKIVFHTHRTQYKASLTNKYRRNRHLANEMLKLRQTGTAFNIRCKEHIQTLRNNNSNSGSSYHILNTGHKNGTITYTTDITRPEKKGEHLNSSRKYHTYLISKDNLHMNETYINTHNPIFEASYRFYTR